MDICGRPVKNGAERSQGHGMEFSRSVPFELNPLVPSSLSELREVIR
jgi:hypothetical protein